RYNLKVSYLRTELRAYGAKHGSQVLAAPHDHGGAGARHRPAHVAAHLGAFDLAAAALLVVVGVPSFAVGPDRTRVVGVVAQLAHVLDHHVDPVGVALAQVA